MPTKPKTPRRLRRKKRPARNPPVLGRRTWDSFHNRQYWSSMPEYYCASTENKCSNMSRANYYAVVDAYSIWQGPKGVKMDAVKDTDRIMVVGDTLSDVIWMEPRDITQDILIEIIQEYPERISYATCDHKEHMCINHNDRLLLYKLLTQYSGKVKGSGVFNSL